MQPPQEPIKGKPPIGGSNIQRPGAPDSPPKKPWVKLHLVPQTQPSVMPEFIIGKLEQEAPTAYVLSNVIEEVETEDEFGLQKRQGLDFINRTYVWRLEILDETPDVDLLNAQKRGMYFPADDGGGLG